MFECSTTISPASAKSLVESVLPRLNEQVFDCWKNTPRFEVKEAETFEGDDDFDEFTLCIQYENPIDSYDECSQGHDAMDLACAFIDGVLVGKGII